MRRTNGAVIALATALTAILFGLGAPNAQAQRQVQLITFTGTTWRYEASGADQGTGWVARTFNDTAWPSGLGLLGGFNGPVDNYPYPFNTVFPTYNDQTITYYFRAHFNMAASDFVWPLSLMMSNLVDDGCIVYLNGNRTAPVALIRVAQDAAFNVPATGGPAAEGAYEPTVTVLTNSLLVGDNVIAVEVHQTGTGSSDICMGLSLTAIVPTALAITAQPQSQVSVTVGQPFILSFGVSGGPALYQWQTNNGAGTFININTPLARFSSYTNTPTVATTNIYRCVASNGVNTVISSTSTVTVIPDKFGPIMLQAIVLEEAARTNRIEITWNEPILTTTVLPPQALTNFSVVLMPNNIVIGISNAQYNPGNPLVGALPKTTLVMNITNWFIRSNYCITVNNVRDLRNNVIAPNSRVCVSWPSTTNVMQMGDVWRYFDSYFLHNAFTGLNMYALQPPWFATNFVEDPSWWGMGCGVLFKDPLNQIANCAGDGNCTEVSIQNQPTLFRRTFMLPTNVVSGTVQFKLRYIYDDGMVLYLNGKEFMPRVNVGGARGDPVIETTLALNNVANPTCTTNDNPTVYPDIQVFPGVNWMAVAVPQGDPLPANGAEDVAFGLEMDVRVYGAAPVLTNPVPRLTITKPTPTSVRLSWNNGYGYALESTPALRGPGLMWMEVQPNMANPMVLSNLSTMGNTCFFRLRKVQGQ